MRHGNLLNAGGSLSICFRKPCSVIQQNAMPGCGKPATATPRCRVRSLPLLANHHEATDFRPWAAAAAARLIEGTASLEAGLRLGPYEILAPISSVGLECR
jgi:hypothetical protein